MRRFGTGDQRRLRLPLLLFAAGGLFACGAAGRDGAISAPPDPVEAHVAPAAPRRAPSEHAVDREARLDHASHPLPEGAPSVVVHAPAGLDPGRAVIVVYLHGWSGCARAVLASGPVACRDGEAPVEGWGLAEQHDAAGTNTVLVVPQLPWLARSGDPGRFGEPGFAQAWQDELVERVLRPHLGIERLGAVVVAAHSGGYMTALSLLEHDLPVRSVLLLDALYGGGEDIARWVAAEPRRRAVSLHTANANTTQQSRLLARRAEESLGPGNLALDPESLAGAVQDHRVVVALSPHGHNDIPAEHLAELLRALPLPRRRSGAADESAPPTPSPTPTPLPTRSLGEVERVIDRPVTSIALDRPGQAALVLEEDAITPWWTDASGRWRAIPLPAALRWQDEPEDRPRIHFGRDGKPRILGTGSVEGRPEPLYLRYRGAAWIADRQEVSELLQPPAAGLYGVLGYDDPEVVCKVGGTCLIKRLTGWKRMDAETTPARVDVQGAITRAVWRSRVAVLDGLRWRTVSEGLDLVSARGAWGSGDALWISEQRDGGVLWRQREGVWQRHPSPVGAPEQWWASAADDLWLAGAEGLAHFDGAIWARVEGVEGPLVEVFGRGGEVWAAGGSGLWRIRRPGTASAPAP